MSNYVLGLVIALIAAVLATVVHIVIGSGHITAHLCVVALQILGSLAMGANEE